MSSASSEPISAASSSTGRSVAVSDSKVTAQKDPRSLAENKWKDEKMKESLRSQGVDTDDPTVKSKLIERWAREYAAGDKKNSSKGSSTARDSIKQGLKQMERGEGAALRAGRSDTLSSADSEDEENTKASLSLKNDAKTPWKTGRASRSSKSRRKGPEMRISTTPSSTQPSAPKTGKSSRKPPKAETDARKELISNRGGPPPDVFDRPPPAPSEKAGTITKAEFNMGQMLEDFSASQVESQTYNCPATCNGVPTTVPVTITEVLRPTGQEWARDYLSNASSSPAHPVQHSQLSSAPVAPPHPLPWQSLSASNRPTTADFQPGFENWLNDLKSNGPRTDLDPSRNQFMIYNAQNAQQRRFPQVVTPFGQPFTSAPSQSPWTAAQTTNGPQFPSPSVASGPWPTASVVSQPSQQSLYHPTSSYPQTTFGASNTYAGPATSSGTYGMPSPSHFAPDSMYGTQPPLTQGSYPSGPPSQPYTAFSLAPNQTSTFAPNRYGPSFGQSGPPATNFRRPELYGIPGAMQTGGSPGSPGSPVSAPGAARLGSRVVNAA